MKSCQNSGGQLAYISSVEENEFVLSLITNDISGYSGLAYIGGGGYANWGGGGPPVGDCHVIEKYPTGEQFRFNGIWWKVKCDMFSNCICATSGLPLALNSEETVYK